MFGFLQRNTQFDLIPQVEDCESLNKESADIDRGQSISAPSSPTSIFCIATLCFISCAASAFLGAWLGGHYFVKSDSSCINRISNYSPLLDDIALSFSTQTFNGSLLKPNIFRQNASPAVDAAWESLGVNYRAIVVPSELAAKSGLTSSHVHVAEKYGGGFPANIEGLHHLHCLNLLRQSLYFNVQYYQAMGKGAFTNEEPILQYHITHCLDILRQQLMCTVDIGVLGKVWWNLDNPTPYPDFNTQHKCRDFEAVRGWAEAHQGLEVWPKDYLDKPNQEHVYESIP